MYNIMNVALLRVCAIALIAMGLNNLVGTLLPLFTLEPEDESFFSNYGPQILSCSIYIIVAAIALIKKSPRLFKIYSVFAIIIIPIGAIAYAIHFYKYLLPVGMGYHHLLEALTDKFVNPFLVVCIAAFFIASPKNESIDNNQKINLDLLRFCTAYFLVNAANNLINMILNFSISADIIVMVLIPIAAGIFALVKKNTLVLKIYSIIAFVYISWNTWDYVREHMFGTYYVWGASIGMIFNSFFVVCAATFFVNLDETRLYAQKLKTLFFKWKNLT